MGRRLKYGEKTKWVSVRVPESKVKMLRMLIREFVEILFIPSLIPKRRLLEIFVAEVLNKLGKNNEIKTKNRHFSELNELKKLI